MVVALRLVSLILFYRCSHQVAKKTQEDGNLSNVASIKAKKLQKIKTNVDNSLLPNTVTMASYQVISKYIS